jgi:metacaspase-1
MKILCIHGIGHQEAPATKPVWEPQWRAALSNNLPGLSPEDDIDFLDYDGLFEGPLAKLSYSDFLSAFGRLAGGLLTRPRALLEFSDTTRWTAGMVVVWVNQADLRQQLQELLLTKLGQFVPDVICAHSLGSLIAYDTFSTNLDAINDRTLVTLGSQIGNSFVAGSVFAGRLQPLSEATHWYHLYNPNDRVFTASLDYGQFQTAPNFTQVETKFGDAATLTDWWSAYTTNIAANHSAVDVDDPDDAYLTNPQTIQNVWRPIAGSVTVPALAPAARARTLASRTTPDRRALLVGINKYATVNEPLEGCANDVFLMSSLLQESGFAAEDIRVVLDDRATADGLRDRFHWLLDGVDSNDERFFFYSGHGAQLPTYGVDGKITHLQSCLVPYDFDWTPAKAITDSDLVKLYSQLPYEARFMMVLDCCYAGGMTRGGGRIRGLAPPDDIRHRMLRWDVKRQMWVQRDLPPLNRSIGQQRNGKTFVGDDKATYRLGRGMSLRTVSNAEYDRTRSALNHKGPYMPIVYEACGESEFSYEYEHGAISYGAFTYSLSAVLRRARQPVSFSALLEQTANVLEDLHYDQHPEAAGPRDILQADVPWHGLGMQAADDEKPS